MLPKDILEKANLAQNKVSETISAAIAVSYTHLTLPTNTPV